MPLLDSLLAFILVVFAISMAVTVIVQVILDLSQFRRFRFRRMLARYYEHGLEPAVRHQLGDAHFALPPAERRQLTTMLGGADANGSEASKTDNLPEVGTRFHDLDPAKVKMQLRASSLGEAIKMAMRDKARRATNPPDEKSINESIDAFFDRLVILFEGYASRAAETYRRFARILSIIVGISLAVIIHADAGGLFKVLLRDPMVRTALATPGEELIAGLSKINGQLSVIEDFVNQQRSLEELAEGLETKLNQLAAPTSPMKQQIDGLQTSFDELKSSAKLSMKAIPITTKKIQNLELTEGQRESLRNGIALLDSVVKNYEGLGWQGTRFEAAAENNGEGASRPSPDNGLSFYIGCIFMGLLAGLGAPFWHDLVKSVAQARRIAMNPASTLGKP